MNRELYDELERLIPYANKAEILYQEYNNIEIEKNKYQNYIDQFEVSGGKMLAIMFFVGLITNSFMTQYLINIPVLGMLFGLLSLPLSIAGGYFGGKFIIDKYQQSKQGKIQVFENKIAECDEKLKQLEEKAYDLGYEIRNEFEINISEQYLYVEAIQKMMDYVVCQRAHTMPECINLYEEELHRLRVEEQNNLILESQYRQEERLRNIQYYDTF